MKLIINGKDISGLTGGVSEYRGDILLSLNFLETLKDSGIQVTKNGDSFCINFKPESLLKLLSKDHPFPINLGIGVTKDLDGQIKGKAELEIGGIGKASIDQSGKIEAGFKLGF